VLIGFISKRKGFQKLLENAFEILEKEKEIENSLLSQLLAQRPASSSFDLGLLGLFSSSAQQAARPPQLSSPCARVTGQPSSPPAEAVRLSPLLVSLPPWGHLSASPSSSFSHS
jgi:hypothetical protein